MERPEGSAGDERTESFVDAPRLMRELQRRKASIAIPTAIAAALGLAFVVIVPSRYTSVARVLLENQESYLTRPDKATNEADQTLDDVAVQSAAESVATPDIARKAIDALGIGDRAEFHPSGLDYVLSMLIGASRPSAGDVVVDSFLNHTTVFPVARSRIVQIEFSSRDPNLAARGANQIAASFLDSRADAKKVEAKAAADWLAGRIDPLRAKVAEAERELESFRSSSGLLTGANGLTNPSQRLAELTTQAAAARGQQSASRAKAEALREIVRSGRIDSIAEAAQNESLRRYAEARVALKSQISELSRTFGPQHPRMKAAEGQLAGLEDEMRLAAQKAVRGYEEDARIAADQVRNIDAEIADQTKAVSSGDGDTVKLRALELDARTAREQLESYIAKYREAAARATDAAAPPNARIIETANPPNSPSFPKRLPTILLMTLAGFVLSLGVAVARALMEEGEGVVAPQPDLDVREAIVRESVPIPPEPVVVHHVEPSVSVFAPPMPEPTRAESDLDAAMATLVEETTKPPFVLLVTGEGARGALAAALAAARRLAGRSSAVLVDLGLTQPWLADAVERDAAPTESVSGLDDLIAGRVGFEKVLHRDLSSELDVALPGVEPLEADDLVTVVAALAENYDFVVLHLSDWRHEAGLAAVGLADGVILCGHAAKLAAMRERLSRARGERLVRIAELVMQKAVAIERVA